MIIDCHGHYTTAPQAHTDWRKAQKDAFAAGVSPTPYPDIPDDEIRESTDGSQLKLMTRAGHRPDHLLAARLGHGAPHRRRGGQRRGGRRASNDLIARVVELYPDSFVGVCQLPQSPGVADRQLDRGTASAA